MLAALLTDNCVGYAADWHATDPAPCAYAVFVVLTPAGSLWLQVTLMSADRQQYVVDPEVAKMSVTIKDMIEGELRQATRH